MKLQHTIISAALAAFASLGAVLPAAAAVTVTFVQPEKFRDLPFSPRDDERLLQDLGKYFATLNKGLPEGQDLRIDVVDLDLAGRMVPNVRGGHDLRVMSRADWPNMKLRYTLSANGHVVSSGEDMLSDMSYLDRLNKYSNGDTLRYEKRMVEDWFNKKFKVGHKG